MKPLNSGQLRVLKNLSVIKRCPLLGGNLIKIVTFGMSAIGRFLCIYYVIKQSSFSTNFRIKEPFNLDYVIRFYKPK